MKQIVMFVNCLQHILKVIAHIVYILVITSWECEIMKLIHRRGLEIIAGILCIISATMVLLALVFLQ